MTEILNTQTAPHFTWGEGCEGWRFAQFSDLSVLRERMPPDADEVLHLHTRVRQLYFVLEGTATVEMDGEELTLSAGEGTHIAPMVPHRMRNRSTAPIEFLVISSSPPREDRRDLA